MKPILKWQYDKLVKELILLQEHQSDPSCPCRTANEMCVRKHLLTIEGYAEETLAIEDEPQWLETLRRLASEARQNRELEEQALCGEGEHPELIRWSRDWRKHFESYSLACEVPAEDLCPLPS